MRTTIKAKVHLLATDKKISYGLNTGDFAHSSFYNQCTILTNHQNLAHGDWIGQHLYFTDNEKIKEGDWRLYYNTGKICKTTKEDLLLIKYYEEECKKIVATTNPELWVNKQCETYKKEHCGGYCCSVPKIDIPFIEAYIKAYNEGFAIIEVLLEGDYQTAIRKDGCPFEKQPENGAYMAHDEHGWEILYPEYAIKFENFKLKLKSNGSVTVHPVKERMYTREEFRKAVRQAWIHSNGVVKFEEWFNKNYPE